MDRSADRVASRLRPEAIAPFAAMLATVAYLASRVVQDGIGLSSLVVAGAAFTNEADMPEELIIRQDDLGYDGQFYYRLSLDPFTRQQTDFGITLDQPPYRQRRILLPVLAWGLSRVTGQSTLLLLPLVNVIGVGLATWAATTLLRRSGANPWLGLVVGLSPGVFLSARLDLAEPLAIGLALCAVAVLQQRPLLATGLMSAAVLSRETTLVLAAGVGIVAVTTLWRSPSSRHWARVALAAVPLGVFAVWQAVLQSWWAASPATGVDRLGAPSAGILKSLVSLTIDPSESTAAGVGWWAVRVLLLSMIAAALVVTRRTRAAPEVVVALWFAAAIVVLLQTLTTPQQALRATLEAYVCAILVLAGATNARARRFVWIALPLSLATLLTTP